MHYQFENILLPDSIVNEPLSHGFVRYRIKPKSTLIAGDSITNNAAIYFDFNAPVITNTAITRIILPTSLSGTVSSVNNLLLYPNPANSILYIECKIITSPDVQIIITDVAGRTVYSMSVTNPSTKQSIDISAFSKGIYFLQFQAGDKISRGRFVKE